MKPGRIDAKRQRIANHDLAGHLDAAYNLARWLLRNQADAEDAVQDAYVRAIRHYAGFRGGDSRAWLLAIVRNTCYDRLRLRGRGPDAVFDEAVHGTGGAANPESMAMASESAGQVQQALEQLPVEYREVFVLREIEQLSYAEIAEVASIPVGTVMSRLSRARERLREGLRAKGLQK